MNTQEAIRKYKYALEAVERLREDALYTGDKNEDWTVDGDAEEITAALTHAIEHMKRGTPVGYDLLPIIPTPEMMQAGSQVKPNPEKDGSWGYVNRVYHAMIGAAPTVKQYLTVEPPKEKRGQWQPIETAPAHARQILLHFGEINYTEIGSYNGLYSWDTSQNNKSYFPTHWMPLPEPPQERKG